MGNNKTGTAKKCILGPVGLIKRENKLYKLTDTIRQTYVELENSNSIPQNRETTQNHRKNNHRHCFEEIQLIFFSGVTGGGRGQSAPQRLQTGKFLLTYREKRGKEKRKRGEGVKIEKKKEKRTIVKGKMENCNWK